jgi:transcriptional regulator with XRE-family HTH domain
MTLDQYLSAKKAGGLREEDFAALVGCTQSHVNRLRHGVVEPSIALVHRIRRATDGAVTAEDFDKSEAAA